ncbi:hypothetical protein D3C87_266130 [compost metagenome]
MGNNLNKPFYYATLFLGLLLSPFLSFSQQDEPKRVSVIISAKEITPQKEIVQIPADNIPKAVSKPTPKTLVKHHQNSAERKSVLAKKTTPKKEDPVANVPAVAKNTPKPSKTTAPVVAVPNKAKSEEIAKKKPAEVEKKAVIETAPVQKSVAATPKTEPKTLATKPDDASAQTNDKTITAVIKADNKNNEVLENATTSKANSFSYIWIGIFLMLAGVVLGLLFGKPAFLISFVGIVFITLGLII